MRKKIIAAGAPADRTVIQPIAINLDKYPRWAPDDSSTVLFAGRFVEKKGLLDAIAAFDRARARVPAARMTIVGEGPDEAAARALVDTAGRVQRRGVRRGDAARRPDPAARACVRPDPSERDRRRRRFRRRRADDPARSTGDRHADCLDTPRGHPERGARGSGRAAVQRARCRGARRRARRRVRVARGDRARRTSWRIMRSAWPSTGSRISTTFSPTGRQSRSRARTAAISADPTRLQRWRPRFSGLPRRRDVVGASLTPSRRARVTVVTSGHLSTCPRMLKSADALAAAGYDVTVVATCHEPWAADADRDVRSRRTWPVRLVNYRRARRAR